MSTPVRYPVEAVQEACGLDKRQFDRYLLRLRQLGRRPADGTLDHLEALALGAMARFGSARLRIDRVDKALLNVLRDPPSGDWLLVDRHRRGPLKVETPPARFDLTPGARAPVVYDPEEFSKRLAAVQPAPTQLRLNLDPDGEKAPTSGSRPSGRARRSTASPGGEQQPPPPQTQPPPPTADQRAPDPDARRGQPAKIGLAFCVFSGVMLFAGGVQNNEHPIANLIESSISATVFGLAAFAIAAAVTAAASRRK